MRRKILEGLAVCDFLIFSQECAESLRKDPEAFGLVVGDGETRLIWRSNLKQVYGIPIHQSMEG